MPKVFIPQAGRSLEVNNGQTILLAALAAGIPYPHGCKSGRCGSCKSRLVSGEVDLLRHTPFALSPEERADGLILACRAQPLTDATVAWLGGADEIADIPVGRFEGAIAGVEDATHDIKLIRVRLDDRGGFTFKAGQYARFLYPGAPSRDYSVASRPDEELVEFHVRRVPEGAASQRIWARAAIGDRVAIEGPLGSAFLREKHSGTILGIAGGSGLAPVKAVAETALAKGMGQPIRIYFGAIGARPLSAGPVRHADGEARKPQLHPGPVAGFRPRLSVGLRLRRGRGRLRRSRRLEGLSGRSACNGGRRRTDAAGTRPSRRRHPCGRLLHPGTRRETHGNASVIALGFDLPATGNPMFKSWRHAKSYEGD